MAWLAWLLFALTVVVLGGLIWQMHCLNRQAADLVRHMDGVLARMRERPLVTYTTIGEKPSPEEIARLRDEIMRRAQASPGRMGR